MENRGFMPVILHEWLGLPRKCQYLPPAEVVSCSFNDWQNLWTHKNIAGLCKAGSSNYYALGEIMVWHHPPTPTVNTPPQTLGLYERSTFCTDAMHAGCLLLTWPPTCSDIVCMYIRYLIRMIATNLGARHCSWSLLTTSGHNRKHLPLTWCKI